MRFCDRQTVVDMLRGRRVALVGSGPGVLDNEPDFVDGHDVVVRVNNYKLGRPQGRRVDVFFSFFGSSIRKTAAQLKADGVKLCIAKCPNAKFMDSPWHEANGKSRGVDFRYIYNDRAGWWFCPTYVPTLEEFRASFYLLGGHVPTTGFAALLEVLACQPASTYITGFDFFASRIHNVTERWRPGDPSDPIGHRPDAEAAWLHRNRDAYPITIDRKLRHRLAQFSKESTT